LNRALAAKQKNSAVLLKSDPAIFGVGVGQSLDNPADAAVLLFVDRKKLHGKLPESVDGQRVRIILMDRLHVTRSHGSPAHFTGGCFAAHAAGSSQDNETDRDFEPFQDRLPLPE
jgi:hypothetical protein